MGTILDNHKSPKISYSTRSAIGALFKAVTLSTDPAHALGFTASLINATRSALASKHEQQVDDVNAIPGIMNTLLRAIATRWVEGGTIEEESYKILSERIDTLFKSTSVMRIDLETYRDICYCDDLHERWKSANTIYQQDARAWSVSNEYLADINKQLMEIITRHDLMEFPRGDGFNLDDHGTDVGSIAAIVAERKRAEAKVK